MHLTAILRASDADQNSSEAGGALDRRRSPRRSLGLSADTNIPSAGDTRVLIRDISPGGILIEAEVRALAVDDRIEINLPEMGVAIGRVAWTSGRFFGCEFNEIISGGAISAALLKAPPQLADKEFALATASTGPFAPRRPWFVPELNFSTALFLSLGLWAIIGGAIYLSVR